MEYKQVILVRQDLKLSIGKLAAQACHASVEALLKSTKEKMKKWRQDGMKKSVLKVKTKEDLFKYKQKAEDAGLITALISDAGHTELPPGTITCLGIGPDEEKKLDEVTGELKLY